MENSEEKKSSLYQVTLSLPFILPEALSELLYVKFNFLLLFLQFFLYILHDQFKEGSEAVIPKQDTHIYRTILNEEAKHFF